MGTKNRLRLLGGPRLFDGDGERTALPAKAYVLALRLLVAEPGHEMSRAQAGAFLWPDAPNPSGNFRQFLRRLAADQERAGIELFSFDAVNVRLNLETTSVDVIELRERLQKLDWANGEAALEVFADGLLAGVVIDEGDLAAWVEAQRAELRDVLIAAVVRLLDRQDARANVRTARAVAARLLEIDPSQEAAYRALMQLFAHEGLMPLVTATFRKCRAVLAKEYATVPSPQTVALFRALVPGAFVEASPGAPDAFPPTPPFGDLLRRAAILPRLVILAPPSDTWDERRWEIATLILDDVIIGLCSLKTISVVAPYTSWQLSAASLDKETTGKFNIGYVLETALRRRDGTARLSAKLFDARTRDILWADSYPLDENTSADCHKALSVAITLSLADVVERQELARFAADKDPQAYYWHLMGQKYLRHMDLPNVRRAAKAFKQSLAADGEFAPAHSGRARAIQREWLLLGRGDDALLDDAERSGIHAVNLDHRDARGYREVALCSLYRRRWDEAIDNFSEGERLSPQHADLISDFGDTLGHCGEPELGLKKIERAMELNPIPPDQYWWNAAGLRFQLHQYREAIDAVGHMGHSLPALRIAAASWAYLGDKVQAEKNARKFLEYYPDFSIDQWLSIVPDRRPEDQRHYELGLRAAGFK